MTFDDWWKIVNEFWEDTGIDRNDLERVAMCRAAWAAAAKAERKRCAAVAGGYPTPQCPDPLRTDCRCGQCVSALIAEAIST